MNRVLLILISFFIAFEIKSIEDLVGRNLICRGKYQIIGYEFLTQNKVIRHASSVSESDYYKNSKNIDKKSQSVIKLSMKLCR